MRIVFIGAVDFSRHCLTEVVKLGGNVVGVLTLAPAKSVSHSDYADLSEVAARYGLPWFQVDSTSKKHTIELLRSLCPDVVFVFGWSQLLPKDLLMIPPLGCIGTHAALLPKNRGRHPLVWALVQGWEQSGLTFLYLDEGIDSGDILWQRPFSISIEDDAGSLYVKIKSLATEAIAEFLPQLERGTAHRVVQDRSQATYLRRRTEQDGEIDWAAPTQDIYNLIRGLTRPYVGAHTFLAKERINVWKGARPEGLLGGEATSLVPGTVFLHERHGLAVRTGDAYVALLEIDELSTGPIAPGMRLGRKDT